MLKVMKNKFFSVGFIFLSILLLSSLSVSAGFWDFLTGKVTDENFANSCAGEGKICGGIAGLICCSGLTCKYDGNYPDASGTCVKENGPYCGAIGTRSEGWYYNNELIKWDNCNGCYAVCKLIGSESEGWYSSCNSALIKWELCGGEETKCTDSDGGKDYNVKGTMVDQNGVTKTDWCQDSTSIGEYYCDNGIGNWVSYFCPAGCKDGACIKESGCLSDNDCASETKKYCDGTNACTSTTYYKCDSGKCVSTVGSSGCGPCPNGCKDGDCIQLNQPCTDSDGGINYYIKGKVTGFWMEAIAQTSPITIEDSCSVSDGKSVVKEYYCKPHPSTGAPKIVSTAYSCENGCSDGACIKTCGPTKCDDGTIYECKIENGQCICPACPPIIIKPVCGNGICESGEGEVCIAVAAMCEEGKECKTPLPRCYVACPQDCKPTEGIYANLNDKFELQVNQPVKIRENEKDIMKITFKDLIAYKCEEQTVTAKTVEEKVAVAEAAMTGRVVTLPQQTTTSATSISGGGAGVAIMPPAQPTAVVLPESTTTQTSSASRSVEVPVTPAQPTVATEIIKCIGAGPKALLGIDMAVNGDLGGGHKVLNLDVGEKKQIDEFTISFLNYDYASRSGTFLVSREAFSCPPKCKCDEKGKVIKCLTGEKCESGTILCPDGKCREKCEIVTEDCKYGCAYEGKCFPVSLRNNGMYCSADLVMSSQKGSDEKCDNNFECSTNVCIDGKCVSSGVIQKIMNWFKGLFGG